MDESSISIDKDKNQNVENLQQENNYDSIYHWLEKIPFSKPPKTLARDFSDGILMAELLKLYYPRLIEIHQCIPANNISMRKENWNTLNRKVFLKINLKLSNNVISQLANCQHGVIEKLLSSLHAKLINEYVNYLQEPTQEDEQNDNNEPTIETIEETIEETEENKPTEIETVEITELETEPRGFYYLLDRVKNGLQAVIILLINIVCFWKWFAKWQTGENPHTEIVCNNTNNHHLVNGQEAAFINGQVHESATRWAYEQLTQEIKEKEDVIATLNYKIAYLEGTMRQKDLRITHLASQVTGSTTEILPNPKQRLLTSGQTKSRPKSHNPLMMPIS